MTKGEFTEKDADREFAVALELRDAGDPHAEDALRQLVKKYPDEPVAWLVLGRLLDARDDYADARACFARAVDLRPTAFLPSQALFHALLDLGLDHEAVMEARRFLKLVRNGEAKCPDELHSLYEDYDREGLEMAAAWRAKTKGSRKANP